MSNTFTLSRWSSLPRMAPSHYFVIGILAGVLVAGLFASWHKPEPMRVQVLVPTSLVAPQYELWRSNVENRLLHVRADLETKHQSRSIIDLNALQAALEKGPLSAQRSSK